MSYLSYRGRQTTVLHPLQDEAVLDEIVGVLEKEQRYTIRREQGRVTFALAPLFERGTRRRNSPLSLVSRGEVWLAREGHAATVAYDLSFHSVLVWGPCLLVVCCLGIFPALVPDPPAFWQQALFTLLLVAVLCSYRLTGAAAMDRWVQDALGKAGEGDASDAL